MAKVGVCLQPLTACDSCRFGQKMSLKFSITGFMSKILQ